MAYHSSRGFLSRGYTINPKTGEAYLVSSFSTKEKLYKVRKLTQQKIRRLDKAMAQGKISSNPLKERYYREGLGDFKKLKTEEDMQRRLNDLLYQSNLLSSSVKGARKMEEIEEGIEQLGEEYGLDDSEFWEIYRKFDSGETESLVIQFGSDEIISSLITIYARKKEPDASYSALRNKYHKKAIQEGMTLDETPNVGLETNFSKMKDQYMPKVKKKGR